MNAIRHYIFMFVGLVVLYFFTGLVATFWVGGLVFFCFSIHRMASFVSQMFISQFQRYVQK